MKPVWIVLLCLLSAAVLAALMWLLVWYIEQRVLAKSLGRASEGADAQAAWEQHILRKQDWTADSEPGTLRRPGGGAHSASGVMAGSGLNTTAWCVMPALRSSRRMTRANGQPLV